MAYGINRASRAFARRPAGRTSREQSKRRAFSKGKEKMMFKVTQKVRKLKVGKVGMKQYMNDQGKVR